MKKEYALFPPSPDLAPWIDSHWYLAMKKQESAKKISLLKPALGKGEFVVHLSRRRTIQWNGEQQHSFPTACLIGILQKPLLWELPSGISLFGTYFKPQGIMAIYPPPSFFAQAPWVDAAAWWEGPLNALCQELQATHEPQALVEPMEAFLRMMFEEAPSPPIQICKALDLIHHTHGNLTVDELSEVACMSERQFQRVFKARLGINPKAYLRLIRFQKSYQYLKTHHPGSWPEVAYQFGYADQAHFIRDFKTFSGASPKRAFLPTLA